ncbi:MAG: sulfatase-like hydrolase/transferase [Lachnospiraceae bacterium]|nr:sulfatase-like hydrolase/transferase [Lachnospiraceae bacterium]MDD7378115.1 sulfatase-like hydrolase/transferase [Lachnospiraceae bacterium]MDY4617359.1 sulfatase-like hydrolase/transferase [Lachnospiraceae bacterium]
MKPETRAKWEKVIAFMNRFSILFHALLSCFLVFIIEVISRRSLSSAITFIGGHTLAYLYNSLIIFVSLSLVYFFRRRALARVIIGGLWLFLGIINGCILAQRVTPFGYTDLKMVTDLLTMQNTNYFTAGQALLAVIGVLAFIGFCVWLWAKGPKFQGKTNKLLTFVFVASCFIWVPITTEAAQNQDIIASYFANIAQGYENYGFVYGFSSSVVDRGMSKPEDYSKETIENIEASVQTEPTSVSQEDMPNVVVVLLESFIDPSEVNFLECSEDPIPNFHNLESNYSSGYMTVPVVGAGTANTEFEVLTGMSLQYFGTGEYPYKTILKQTDCESIASDLSKLGYGTHVVHNNGGNFYSRANAFSMMGFDTFTSKELMNITEYTPLGSWPTDDILIDETIKAMDATPDQQDFVYTITVQGHGDYPTEKVIENPEITVSGAEDEATNNQWEYYINEIHEVDKFIGNLTQALAERDEDTILVLWGDHLPTLGLSEEDMATGDIFKTKYVTWNNFGMAKEDADLTSYQLLAHLTGQLGIHEGTIFRFHQSQSASETYLRDLENLQYDLLYGNRYAYHGEEPYPASDLVMGIDEVTIKRTWMSTDGKLMVYGEHFTPWSKVFINGDKVSTTYVSGNYLKINADKLEEGDILVVNQMGSSNTIFRSSNEYTYLPAVTSFTDDAQQLPNETNIENQDEVIDNMNNNEVIEEIQEGTEEPVKQIPPATAKE